MAVTTAKPERYCRFCILALHAKTHDVPPLTILCLYGSRDLLTVLV